MLTRRRGERGEVCGSHCASWFCTPSLSNTPPQLRIQVQLPPASQGANPRQQLPATRLGSAGQLRCPEPSQTQHRQPPALKADITAIKPPHASAPERGPPSPWDLSRFLDAEPLKLVEQGAAEGIHRRPRVFSRDKGVQPLVEQQDRQPMNHRPEKDGLWENAFRLAGAGRKPRHFLLQKPERPARRLAQPRVRTLRGTDLLPESHPKPARRLEGEPHIGLPHRTNPGRSRLPGFGTRLHPRRKFLKTERRQCLQEPEQVPKMMGRRGG